jgi:hypothetical protein
MPPASKRQANCGAFRGLVHIRVNYVYRLGWYLMCEGTTSLINAFLSISLFHPPDLSKSPYFSRGPLKETMPKLSTWIRKKMRSFRDNNDDHPKPSTPLIPYGLPVLPAKRQHILTPSPSRENLKIHHGKGSSASFFQRLPFELRREIYLIAFGNRTVHMDLEYNYAEPTGKGHARRDRDAKFALDRSVPPEWRWWSSVCHRNPVADIWLDQCRSGDNYAMCYMFPGKWPDKCYLGLMGWLLTCRQA